MQSLPKCFDSGLQYVHDLDIKKKKKARVRCSAPDSGLRASMGHSHPRPPATSFEMRLRPRLPRVPGSLHTRGSRQR